MRHAFFKAGKSSQKKGLAPGVQFAVHKCVCHVVAAVLVIHVAVPNIWANPFLLLLKLPQIKRTIKIVL